MAETCPVCKGSGRIYGANWADERTCGRCNGAGVIPNAAPRQGAAKAGRTCLVTLLLMAACTAGLGTAILRVLV